MIVAATVGSYIGAGIVSKLPTQKVQLVMGVALFVTGVIFALQLAKLFPSGDEQSLVVGLTGIQLIIAIAVNFLLGALMTVGIGRALPSSLSSIPKNARKRLYPLSKTPDSPWLSIWKGSWEKTRARR